MALRLLDEYGLPDLTMRNIATALEVRASALYWHFPNKQALLASVSARILAPMESVEVEDLTVSEAVRRLGARLRECLLAYRDAAELVSSSLALGLVDSPVRPHLTAVTRRDGVPDPLSRVAAEAVMHFVVGYTFHEQQRLTADSFGLLPPDASLDPESASARPSESGDFEEALKMIADGLEVSARQHTETSTG
jgi:AcrR family transcriptional regulator